jgi:hypothetical protein
VGVQIDKNLVIDAVLQGKSGAMQLKNSQDIDMLAGYAYVPPPPGASWPSGPRMPHWQRWTT